MGTNTSHVYPEQAARTATLVVAASNASALEQAQADYVCDGTADDVQIAAAIAALPATGGIVQLTGGLFTFAAEMAILSNVWLRGAGLGITTIKAKDTFGSTTLAFINYSGTSGPTYATNIHLSDFTLDGNKANQAAAVQVGIWLDYVKGATIERVEVKNINEGCGIDISHSVVTAGEISRIIDCYSHDNERNGIDCNSPGVADGLIIQGCHCDLNDYNGVFYTGAKGQILNNYCYGNGNHGIGLSAPTYTTVRGNHCDANTWSGIGESSTATNNLIDGNECQGNGNYGVGAVGDNTQVTNNHIFNNGKTAGLSGIDIATGSYMSVQGNTVRKGAAGNNHAYGINVASGTGHMVKDNDLYDSGVTANLADAGTSTKISGNRGFIAPGEERTIQASLVATGTKLTNATGTLTESGVYLIPGANVLNITGAGTFTVTLPAGTTGTAASGTATLVGSPITLSNALVIDSGVTTGNITVTLTCIAAAIANPEAQACLVKRLVIDETTPGGTATSVFQGGLADNSVGLNIGSELFTGADANAAAIRDSWLAGDTGAQTKYLAWPASGADSVVAVKTLTEKADALVGKATVYYVGR